MSEQKETRCQFCNALLLSEKSANAKCANGESLVDFLGMSEVKGAMPMKLWDDQVKEEYIICNECFNRFTPLLRAFDHICMKAMLDTGRELKEMLNPDNPQMPSRLITKGTLYTLVRAMLEETGKACFEIGKVRKSLVAWIEDLSSQDPASRKRNINLMEKIVNQKAQKEA